VLGWRLRWRRATERSETLPRRSRAGGRL